MDAEVYGLFNKKIEELNSELTVSIIQESSSAKEIVPNKFYKWGEIEALTITLAPPVDAVKYNEYMFEFVSGTKATVLTLPATVKWLSPPFIKANKIYQCSILNGIGVLLGV